MSRRNQSRRRRSYGRRQHDIRERRSAFELPAPEHVDRTFQELSGESPGRSRPESAGRGE